MGSALGRCCQIGMRQDIMAITFYLFLVFIVQVSYCDSLRCYGGRGGGKFQECHQDDGYKTCFTKYENGVRVARGCATKRPMLYVECEAHKSKSVLEEFCYCSYDLCNTSPASRIIRSMSLGFITVIL